MARRTHLFLTLALLTWPTLDRAEDNPYGLSYTPPTHVGPFDGSYAQCILKEMPSVANDATAVQINVACIRKYPAGLNTDEGPSSFDPFGYSSGPQCSARKGKDTQSRFGGTMIAAACNKLYGP